MSVLAALREMPLVVMTGMGQTDVFWRSNPGPAGRTGIWLAERLPYP